MTTPQQVTRATDPDTSYEAASGIDLIKSEMCVLTYIKKEMSEHPFTDTDLVAGYRASDYPTYSEQRIRSARKALADHGHLAHVGREHRTGHRNAMNTWTLA